MRVLVVGKDARTDALVEGLAGSAEVIGYSDLRNPGLAARCASLVIGPLDDVDRMAAAAKGVDLVVIGPEGPLAAGLADAVEALGIPCFGPRRNLARIETSKAWTRSLVEERGIEGNPAHRTFTSVDGLRAYVEELGAVVVKPDGLTGGKGVKVQGEHLASPDEAVAYATACLEADGQVVVEEKLEGEEFSLQTITDGSAVVHCPAVQDHKRAFDGDTGPNTGGMGSYSWPDGLLPFISAEDLRAAQAINEKVVAALGGYRGVLYGGFMATRDGVRLIEYNARFGDPEAMNVLNLLDHDLLELTLATATGRLGSLDVRFRKQATVCKYVVPAAYPEPGGAGDEVSVADGAGGAKVYWAAVSAEGGRAVMTGSRALAFVGAGDTLGAAEQVAEAGASSVTGNVRHRRDIGTADAIARRLAHMRSLREPSG
jgi:phosphoribosylamine--glycine ligase